MARKAPGPEAGGGGFESRRACLYNLLIPRENLDFLRRHEKRNAGSLYHYCTKRISYWSRKQTFDASHPGATAIMGLLIMGLLDE
ncbi:MAG: hypothetical protein WCG85_19290 [Polyangia bacterium]